MCLLCPCCLWVSYRHIFTQKSQKRRQQWQQSRNLDITEAALVLLSAVGPGSHSPAWVVSAFLLLSVIWQGALGGTAEQTTCPLLGDPVATLDKRQPRGGAGLPVYSGHPRLHPALGHVTLRALTRVTMAHSAVSWAALNSVRTNR